MRTLRRVTLDLPGSFRKPFPRISGHGSENRRHDMTRHRGKGALQFTGTGITVNRPAQKRENSELIINPFVSQDFIPDRLKIGIAVRIHGIIYDAIREIEAAIRGMQAPKFEEVVYGQAEVRETYKVSHVGTVCGCYVQSGKIVRGCMLRVIRDGVVIYSGKLGSLRRFKDDVKEVATNYECGMTVEGYNDVETGDILEAFAMEEIKE